MSPAARPPGTDRGSAAALLLLTVALLGGCGQEPPPRTDPELTEALGLPPGTPVHRIDLSGRADRVRALPAAVEVRLGELVQFVVADSRVYSVVFPPDGLSPEQVGFLRSTGQQASPPLVEPGARFVLSFDGAPPGDYPFVVQGFGEEARGRIRVLGSSGGRGGGLGPLRVYSARPPHRLAFPPLTSSWRVSRSSRATASARR